MGDGYQRQHLGPFLYVWLAISALLNISGMAGIVDGFVAWAGFLRELADLYKTWIREPMLWAAHLVWPTWLPRISNWIIDWLCIAASFALAANIHFVSRNGHSLFHDLQQSGGTSFAILLTGMFAVLGPLMLPLMIGAILFQGEELNEHARQTVRWVYLYWLMFLGTFALLVFLNWQLRRAGIW